MNIATTLLSRSQLTTLFFIFLLLSMASSSKPQTLKNQSFFAPTLKIGATILEKPNTSVLPEALIPPMEDSFLSKSSHFTREEVLRRRLNNVKRLSRVYKDHYWALMEEIKVKYREYYWKYGVSPHKEETDPLMSSFDWDVCTETNTNIDCSFGGRNNNGGCGGGKLGLGFEELKYEGNNRCSFVGCKLKAMALTAFCHLHILSDPRQKLYKSCNYLIKSAQAGPITCGKPILRSNVPSWCNVHSEKFQKEITRALKKAGLTTSSSKLAPKFNVIVAEYVHQIKSKRRAFKRPGNNKAGVKEEYMS